MYKVHYKVKVIIDAEVGSIATKAKEIKATWVILDRFQKKEAGQCIKQLNSNVVLIDHQIPRIIKAVTSMIGENFTDKQYHFKTNHYTINNSHDFLYLNSEYFDEDLKISSSDIDELNHKSIISLHQGEA
ncbi:hypothetical protein P8452_03265 [Trifolium repens]|nr:hypothetical protein P8452_03265 [Trifolium repens]